MIMKNKIITVEVPTMLGNIIMTGSKKAMKDFLSDLIIYSRFCEQKELYGTQYITDEKIAAIRKVLGEKS